MKKLIHLAAPLRNVGDNALILGVKEQFKQVNLDLKPLRSTVINRSFINLVNEKYDGLIIGGGGLLHAPKSILDRTKDTSGTLIMVDTNNLKYLKKPLIIFGVGYNVFRGETDLPDIAKKSIEDLVKAAIHFSVRNDGSYTRLSNFLGKELKEILVTPDPGLFMNSSEFNLSNKVKGKNIAIQLAADRLNHRFNGKIEVDRFISEIKKFVLSNPEINFWITSHCPIDEKFVNKHFKEFKRVPIMLGLCDAEKMMGFYKKMDVVIGQRGHGNICPFGINVPIISLVSHDKNLGFMEDVGFQDYAVSASNKNLSNELNVLINKIDDSYIEKQRIKNLELKKISDNHVKKIISQL